MALYLDGPAAGQRDLCNDLGLGVMLEPADAPNSQLRLRVGILVRDAGEGELGSLLDSCYPTT